MSSAAMQHLDDAALVRVIDRQTTPDDDDAHLAGCDACQARLRTLQARSAGFSRALASARAAEPAPPADLWRRVQAAAAAGPQSVVVDLGRERQRRARGHAGPRWGTPAMRAAAVALLLVGGALTAEPVRAWIAGAIETAVLALRGGPADPTGTGPVPMPTAPSAVTVSFIPAVDRLVLRIDESQPAGTVHVIFENRPDALGEVLTEDEDASLLVLPDGFRARNVGEKEWSYRFTLPATLAGARIVVAGRTVAEPAPEDGELRLDLGALSRRAPAPPTP